MKKRSDYTGRQHYKVIKMIDDIEFRHYPGNKIIRYTAVHKGEYYLSRQYVPGDEEKVLQDIKNRLYDITVLKLKTPPPPLFEIETKTVYGKARKLKATWTVESAESMKADYDFMANLIKEERDLEIIKNIESKLND